MVRVYICVDQPVVRCTTAGGREAVLRIYYCLYVQQYAGCLVCTRRVRFNTYLLYSECGTYSKIVHTSAAVLQVTRNGYGLCTANKFAPDSRRVICRLVSSAPAVSRQRYPQEAVSNRQHVGYIQTPSYSQQTALLSLLRQHFYTMTSAP